MGQRIEIDEALAAYRTRRDPVAEAGQSLAAQLEQGLLSLHEAAPTERCPHT